MRPRLHHLPIHERREVQRRAGLDILQTSSRSTVRSKKESVMDEVTGWTEPACAPQPGRAFPGGGVTPAATVGTRRDEAHGSPCRSLGACGIRHRICPVEDRQAGSFTRLIGSKTKKSGVLHCEHSILFSPVKYLFSCSLLGNVKTTALKYPQPLEVSTWQRFLKMSQPSWRTPP
jgi:hypothetical protein